MAAAQLPLAKAANGADASAHVPEGIDLRTCNSEQAVKHPALCLQPALPQRLQGVRQLTSRPGEKQHAKEGKGCSQLHSFLVP